MIGFFAGAVVSESSQRTATISFMSLPTWRTEVFREKRPDVSFPEQNSNSFYRALVLVRLVVVSKTVMLQKDSQKEQISPFQCC